MNTFKSMNLKILVGGLTLSAIIALLVSVIVLISADSKSAGLSFLGTLAGCQSIICIFWIPIALWLFPLIDCISNEPSNSNDKIVWMLLIIFTNLLGGVLYLLIRRPQRIRDYGR